MTLTLYDLAMADIDVRPSPYCWLAKFGLLHKGLDFETVPLRFAEKQNYPDPEHARLPILKDGEEIICDSANILAHLDKRYPGKPIVATSAEQAAADFYTAWMGAHLFPALAPMLMLPIWQGAHEDDKEYFRTMREARFGKPLEELAATPGLKEKAEAAMKTLAAPLTRFDYLGGDAPNLCDYTVFGVFMWRDLATSEALFETPAPVDAWRERMLDQFDGYARNALKAA